MDIGRPASLNGTSQVKEHVDAGHLFNFSQHSGSGRGVLRVKVRVAGVGGGSFHGLTELRFPLCKVGPDRSLPVSLLYSDFFHDAFACVGPRKGQLLTYF